MTTARPIGLSILSAAGLIGTTKLFTRGGAYRAARAATRLGFGLQLLPFGPLPGLTESFQDFVERLNPASVLAFEGRWGDADPWHPWRHLSDGVAVVPAYYTLFPVRYRTVRRQCQFLRQAFPHAIAVDCPVEGASEEISHRNNPDPAYWCARAQTGEPLVLDTYHLQEAGWDPAGTDWLSELLSKGVNISLLHVQLRHQAELEAFVQDEKTPTEAILRRVSEVIRDDTPVIIELPPWLVSKERLRELRDRIEAILS